MSEDDESRLGCDNGLNAVADMVVAANAVAGGHWEGSTSEGAGVGTAAKNDGSGAVASCDEAATDWGSAKTGNAALDDVSAGAAAV